MALLLRNFDMSGAEWEQSDETISFMPTPGRNLIEGIRDALPEELVPRTVIYPDFPFLPPGIEPIDFGRGEEWRDRISAVIESSTLIVMLLDRPTVGVTFELEYLVSSGRIADTVLLEHRFDKLPDIEQGVWDDYGLIDIQPRETKSTPGDHARYEELLNMFPFENRFQAVDGQIPNELSSVLRKIFNTKDDHQGAPNEGSIKREPPSLAAQQAVSNHFVFPALKEPDPQRREMLLSSALILSLLAGHLTSALVVVQQLADLLRDTGNESLADDYYSYAQKIALLAPDEALASVSQILHVLVNSLTNIGMHDKAAALLEALKDIAPPGEAEYFRYSHAYLSIRLRMMGSNTSPSRAEIENFTALFRHHIESGGQPIHLQAKGLYRLCQSIIQSLREGIALQDAVDIANAELDAFIAAVPPAGEYEALLRGTLNKIRQGETILISEDYRESPESIPFLDFLQSTMQQTE